MAWGLNATTGFSGLSAITTGPQGTGATSAAPATASGGNSTPQGATSIGITCPICNNPTVKQGLFLFALLMLWVFWHTHLHSLLD